MSHTALARKYRPTRFADLVGQEHVAAGLTGAVARSRVAHGYLLTGPRGVGKTTAARILAMALNCETDGARETGEPCAECESCQRIWSGNANLDVVEIDAASNRGVDDARELRERAMYAPSGPERFKVYIVDEAHMLTREAWNALLKILEEPPPRVVFVFATTEPQKISNVSAAVVSRLQRFDFRNIGPASIADRLRSVATQENIQVEDDALVLISRVANGGMRDSLSMLDQTLVFGDGPVSAERVRDALGLISDEAYGELLGIIADRQSGEVFPFVERIVNDGADIGEFVNGMGEVLRALMMVKVGGEPRGLTASGRAAIEGVAERLEAGDVLRMLRLLGEAEANIRMSANPRLHAEALILQWTIMDRTVDLEAVLGALGGAPPPSADPPRPAPGPDRAAAPGAKPAPASQPPAPAARTLAGVADVREAWAEAIEVASHGRAMLREVLRQATVTGFDEDLVTITAEDPNAAAGIERGLRELGAVLTKMAGRPIAVGMGPATPPPVVAEDTPRRQTADQDRGDRLKVYRAQDEALDGMVEALDLELQE